MALSAKTPLIVELSQVPPKMAKAIYIQKMGNISGIEVASDLVLVATYFRPEKTAGGIIRPDDNIREDEYQGKVGLAVKLGPAQDVTDGFISTGDWVVYSIKDGWSVTVNGMACRLVPLERIRMKVSDPSVVF